MMCNFSRADFESLLTDRDRVELGCNGVRLKPNEIISVYLKSTSPMHAEYLSKILKPRVVRKNLTLIDFDLDHLIKMLEILLEGMSVHHTDQQGQDAQQAGTDGLSFFEEE